MGIRAQAIIIREEKMLFAHAMVTSLNQLRHSFIGGRVEADENPAEAVLRELLEEANVQGDIIFEISHRNDHRTFLVDIGQQEPVLGCDPEEEHLAVSQRSLKGLVWMDLHHKDLFTDIDRSYFAQLFALHHDRS